MLKKIFILFLLSLIIHATLFAQLCRFEKTNGEETATYDEIIEWYKIQDKKSYQVKFKQWGETDAGEPLPIVYLDADGDFSVNSWKKKNKTILFINNGIHPGEPDGIDASMMLVRDIANKKFTIPKNLSIVIIGVYNIGGCLNRNSTSRVSQIGPKEYGFRGNSQYLDLNRDFIKCDSKESMSFNKLFTQIDPHVFLDTHVSNGADYQYTMTILTTQYDKLGGVVGSFLKEKFEPLLYQEMKNKNWEMTPYVDFDNKTPEAGMTMFYDAPRYSSGYASLFGCMSFLSETHMLKSFKQRTESTRALLETLINATAKNGKIINENRILWRNNLIQQNKLALKYIVDTTEFTLINFKGYNAETVMSKVNGKEIYKYNRNSPYEIKLPYRNKYKPIDEITLPKAYIIPAGWHNAIQLLKNNNVGIKKILKDTLIEVETCRITNYESAKNVYEKHHRNSNIKFTVQKEIVLVPRNSVLVQTNQYQKKYIAQCLEPKSEDGFFAWNFFDAILQQKEGYSEYSWDDLAYNELENNSTLKKIFEEKKLTDKKFADDKSAQLRFIYQNSKYCEKGYNLYPIYFLR